MFLYSSKWTSPGHKDSKQVSPSLYNINLLVIISWVNLNDWSCRQHAEMFKRPEIYWFVNCCLYLIGKILILFVLNNNNNRNILKIFHPVLSPISFVFFCFLMRVVRLQQAMSKKRSLFSPFYPQQRVFPFSFFFLLMHNFPIKNIIFHHYAITIFAVWILLPAKSIHTILITNLIFLH